MLDGALRTRVLRSDHFGNLVLDARSADMSGLGARPGAKVTVQLGSLLHHARVARAFADVPEGELLLYEDSQRLLSLAVNRGSAAELLGAAAGEQLEVRLA